MVQSVYRGFTSISVWNFLSHSTPLCPYRVCHLGCLVLVRGVTFDGLQEPLSALFSMGCFQEGQRPIKAFRETAHKGQKLPIQDRKRAIKANGLFSGTPPWWKTAPLKGPFKRSMRAWSSLRSRISKPSLPGRAPKRLQDCLARGRSNEFRRIALGGPNLGCTQTHPRQSQSSQFSSYSIHRICGTCGSTPACYKTQEKQQKRESRKIRNMRTVSARKNWKSGNRGLWMTWTISQLIKWARGDHVWAGGHSLPKFMPAANHVIFKCVSPPWGVGIQEWEWHSIGLSTTGVPKARPEQKPIL